MLDLKDRYEASILLSAIGDALGWMTEFVRTPQDLETRFNTNRIDKYYQWNKPVGGRFHGYIDKVNAGDYSDDTQLLLAVARSITKQGNVDQNQFAKIEFPQWLLYARGAGRTIKNAARKIQRKSADWNNNFFSFKIKEQLVDYRECGANGAAMRILPIVLANHSNWDKIKKEVFANSIISHGHPRAILGALLYAYLIDQFLGVDKTAFSPKEFIVGLGKEFEKNFILDFMEQDEFKSWLNKWNENQDKEFKTVYQEVLKETLVYLRILYKGLENDDVPLDVLKKLGCLAPQTKGSGTSTVLGGLYLSLRFFSKPTDGILEAVNTIGSDTDSVAAFTGGLLGAIYGSSIIPEEWRKVQDANYLERIADDLYQIHCGTSTKEVEVNLLISSESIDKIESSKYKKGNRVHFTSLGLGEITNVDFQKPLTKGKFNLILSVTFDLGQTCIFHALLNGEVPETKVEPNDRDLISEIRELSELNLDTDLKTKVYHYLGDVPDERVLGIIKDILQKAFDVKK
ncbi:ADP-ribosylglycohydrolase family protein [Labilibaculum antarcticum]|uniref:ADP-ribosylglycohydrolase n=1 Tax=Labilibaculum antarcticum TaxID=1717717 RepID=A0A1Y1CKB1_9BACT|nr:ADP-ribosylglycohydrolase family protein [Labilibaculum antarcticum]BAX80829.1 hypothetical protein ALGA_2507 [Labilibaculum antarcticum]